MLYKKKTNADQNDCNLLKSACNVKLVFFFGYKQSKKLTN